MAVWLGGIAILMYSVEDHSAAARFVGFLALVGWIVFAALIAKYLGLLLKGDKDETNGDAY